MSEAGATTLLDYLERAGRLSEGGLRFVDRNENATWFGWAEVRDRALVVAAGLLALGIEKGDRVALVYPTGIEFFEAFFGAILAGAVPVPLYPPVRLGRMSEYLRRTARMIELSGARLVLADRRIRRILGEAVAEARPALGCRGLDELPQAAAGQLPAAVRPSDLALVQFSRGPRSTPSRWRFRTAPSSPRARP
jgi:acyl-CoA synthetase (AMP-forming)/AMP-acid ligase II